MLTSDPNRNRLLQYRQRVDVFAFACCRRPAKATSGCVPGPGGAVEAGLLAA